MVHHRVIPERMMNSRENDTADRTESSPTARTRTRPRRWGGAPATWGEERGRRDLQQLLHGGAPLHRLQLLLLRPVEMQVLRVCCVLALWASAECARRRCAAPARTRANTGNAARPLASSFCGR